jgi:hypothetical protein
MKTILTFLLLFVFTVANSFAQNSDSRFTNPGVYFENSDATLMATLSTVAASPHAVSRSCATFANVGGVPHIFQFGGGGGAQYTNVARYNIQTDTWTNNFSTMPANISSGTAVTMNDSIIYVFGGENGAGLGKTLKWNYISNTWTTMVNMSTLVTDALVLKYNDSLVYVIGGGTGLFGTGYFNNIQVYNTNSNTYSSGGTYPIVAGMMGGGIYGDTIYSVGGWTGSASSSNAYKGVINPATLQVTWTPLPAYPVGTIHRCASGFVKKGNGGGVFIAGGEGAAGVVNSARFWNICLQTWETLPNLSVARSNFKAGILPGDSVAYLVSGYNGAAGVGTTEKLTFNNIDGACFTTTGVVNNYTGIANDYALSQNYPNPFNPVTIINYSVPASQNVKLVVYDAMGREISVLTNEFKLAGSYSVAFDGSDLSSGVYYYSISSGDFKATKKMLLVK